MDIKTPKNTESFDGLFAKEYSEEVSSGKHSLNLNFKTWDSHVFRQKSCASDLWISSLVKSFQSYGYDYFEYSKIQKLTTKKVEFDSLGKELPEEELEALDLYTKKHIQDIAHMNSVYSLEYDKYRLEVYKISKDCILSFVNPKHQKTFESNPDFFEKIDRGVKILIAQNMMDKNVLNEDDKENLSL